MRRILIALTALFATAAQAEIAPRDGWIIHETEKSHAELVDSLKAAVKDNGFGVVTEAGPTAMAAQRGIEIPENRVVGVFNNDYAVKILDLSVAAMIEAPVRFYVTEEEDGTATLSYKTPSFVFLPYADDGGDLLAALAAELDTKFNDIAMAAIE
ncbi:DUF302 domain-containing protein [Sulfitobacter sp. D35]|uniref:DUF302 domain-containing protein n=1 Tax=Sulfitobacter sp. D35 TaxID=3083252 RepID=UPI00296F0422|nr:DUF302 domain-containing protein [Sulfitobacter sp. D35]MDW4498610.1 DUF302 domain-containing protein [Sulfitobacter sp. D35]